MHNVSHSAILRTIVMIALAAACPALWPPVTIASPTASPIAQAGDLSSAAPEIVQIAEEDDFATTVLGDPWDMDQATDLYTINPDYPQGPGFSEAAFAGGVFRGTTRAPGASLWLLHQGLSMSGTGEETANNIDPHSGIVNPINAARYRYLSFRLYRTFPASASPQVRVYWYKPGDEKTGIPCGSARFLASYPGWHIYTLDLGLPENWAAVACPWSGQVTGLRIDPAGIPANEVIALDWVRLVDPNSAVPFTVNWDLGAQGGQRSVSLLLDNDDNPNNGVLGTIASGLPGSGPSSYVWGVKGLPAGAYRVHAWSGGDYAGSVLGDPWDFAQASDYLHVAGAGNLQLANGLLSGASANGDPQVELRVDPTHAINASAYHHAYARINLSQSAYVMFYWAHAGEGFDANYSNFVYVPAGWQTVEIDLSSPLKGSWSGLINQFRCDPATEAGINFQIDWIALTAGEPPASEAALLPASLASIAAPVINAAPLLHLLAPSMESGPDYATTVLGAPWNFDDVSMIVRAEELASAAPNPDGHLDAVTTAGHTACPADCGDAKLWLRVSPDPSRYINPNRFKYFTIRYRQSGHQDLAQGWVMRLIWSPTNMDRGAVSVLDDIVVRDAWPTYGADDGWHTYQGDLSKLRLDPGAGAANWGWNDSKGWIREFRLDPTEVPASTQFSLKQVLLTGDPVASGNYQIAWDITNPDDVATVTAYYDTDRDPANKTLIGSTQQPATGLNWDTTAVSEGAYYIYLQAADGVNTTGRYSSVPVIVRHAAAISLSTPAGYANKGLLRGREYAADVLGNAWDMDRGDDLDPNMLRDVTTPSFKDGIVSFTTTGNDPYFTPLWDAGRPADAGIYRALYFRMYSSAYATAQVGWFDGRGGLHMSSSFPTAPGWQVYKVDLSGEPAWTGSISRLRIDPADAANVRIMFDWVKLTDPTSGLYPMTWSVTNAGNARLALYTSQTPGGSDPARLTADLDPDQGGALLDLSWPDPGYYQFYAQVDDPVNGALRSAPTRPLRVARQEEPTLEVTPLNIQTSIFFSRETPDSAHIVTLDNWGVQNYSWTATSDLPWITVSPAAGDQQPAQLSVAVNPPPELAGSTYTGHITIDAPNVGMRVVTVSTKVLLTDSKLYLPYQAR